jgi:hypothetical protein
MAPVAVNKVAKAMDLRETGMVIFYLFGLMLPGSG